MNNSKKSDKNICFRRMFYNKWFYMKCLENNIVGTGVKHHNPGK